jgi:tRNA pseudouridine55 synthase
MVVGRFTRLSQFYMESDKRYQGTIRFGFSTDTYDAEGEPTSPEHPFHISLEDLRQAATTFLGRIQQMPPRFSAKKIEGVPAYKLARKNQEIELKPKQVEIKEFEIIGWDGQKAQFQACVREFTIENAHSLDELAAAGKPDPQNHPPYLQRPITDIMLNNGLAAKSSPFEGFFLHPRLILPEFPAVTASPEALVRMRHGNPTNLPEFSKASLVKVFEGQARLIAIAKRIAGTLFQPKVVLA